MRFIVLASLCFLLDQSILQQFFGSSDMSKAQFFMVYFILHLRHYIFPHTLTQIGAAILQTDDLRQVFASFLEILLFLGGVRSNL
jgi:hypothetical protein